MNKLIRKIAMKLGVGFVTKWVRGVAEGHRAHFLGRAYWWLAGKKRAVSAILGLVAAALASMGETQAAAIIGTVALIGFALGVVDKSWREVDLPAKLKASWWWKLLANNAPVLAIAAAASHQWFGGPSCSLEARFCTWGAYAVAFIAAISVQAGLMDAAWRSKAPNLQPGRPSRPRRG